MLDTFRSSSCFQMFLEHPRGPWWSVLPHGLRSSPGPLCSPTLPLSATFSRNGKSQSSDHADPELCDLHSERDLCPLAGDSAVREPAAVMTVSSLRGSRWCLAPNTTLMTQAIETNGVHPGYFMVDCRLFCCCVRLHSCWLAGFYSAVRTQYWLMDCLKGGAVYSLVKDLTLETVRFVDVFL